MHLLKSKGQYAFTYVNQEFTWNQFQPISQKNKIQFPSSAAICKSDFYTKYLCKSVQIHSGFTNHSGPKMLKSKQRGAGPKFIYHVKGDYIVISKNKIFFKSVEGKFWQLSEKIWAGFPRALLPGISMKQKDQKSKKRALFLHY